jgi:hypothetical protein
MSDMRSIIEKLTAIAEDRPTIGDGVYLEFGNVLEVDTEIMEISSDSITLLGDEKLFKVLESLDDVEHKHGTPYDRGRADSYYGRRHNPHKLVPNVHGGHEHEKLTDPSEVEAYSKGYRENTDKKDYGESVNLSEAPITNIAMPGDTPQQAAVRKAIVAGLNQDYVGWSNIVNDIANITADGTVQLNPGSTNFAKTMNNILAYGGMPGAKVEVLKYDWEKRADAKLAQEIKNWKSWTYRLGMYLKNPIGYENEKNGAYIRTGGQVESIEEGEVVSLQDNQQTLKRLVKMWWNGDEGKHAQAAKMLDNMGWEIEEEDDDVVLYKDGEEIRFFMDDLYEAEYHGRKVPLSKPMRGDVKKFKVFVKDPKTGNIKKVNFGDPNMRIKKSNPKRRKSFRARHHCDTNPGPRTKARYWSCRKW